MIVYELKRRALTPSQERCIRMGWTSDLSIRAIARGIGKNAKTVKKFVEVDAACLAYVRKLVVQAP